MPTSMQMCEACCVADFQVGRMSDAAGRQRVWKRYMNAHKTSVISDRLVKRHKCRAPGARLFQPQHVGRIRTLSPNATGLERGCVRSTSRSTLKRSAASGVFQQAGFAKLLRLVPPRRDTAALRGQCVNAPQRVRQPQNLWNYFPLRMWGRHSCLPVPGTFQSPDSASNYQLWSAKLENFATGRLESPPYNLGNTPSSCARTRGRVRSPINCSKQP
jgi:hypothetical protein